MGKSMEMKNKISLPLLIVAALASQITWAGPAERAMAKRIHDRLTGVTVDSVDPDGAGPLKSPLTEMEELLMSDTTGKSAAEYAINTAQNPNAHYFYNVTLKNFAAPWTNEEQTVFTPLNDYTATVVGAIRDGLDFRRILYDDLLYVGTGVTAYSNSNNTHYEELEARNPATTGNLASGAVLQQRTQSSVRSGVPAAGIMTSRAGAMAFFSGGTNRAMFRFTLMNHLCIDLEPLKDVTRTPDHVRRDVSRSPGGDSRIFMNGCVGCHAGMDGMAGAFAKYEWDYGQGDGVMLYGAVGNSLFGNDGAADGIPDDISLKHNINGNNFEYGHITTDDGWINYWRNGPNSKLGVRPLDGPLASGWGWNPPGALPQPPGVTVDPDKGTSSGTGARSLGIELSGTRAFAQCQVDKAFKAICLRDPNVFSSDRIERDNIVSNFVGNNYDMREVFTDVAAYCKD